LEQDSEIVGALGWQVDNLVTRADEVVLVNDIPVEQALPKLISAMEEASAELQSEAAIVYSDPALAKSGAWKSSGYEPTAIKQLGVKAWEEAAEESMVPNTTMLFKRLRADRILRPI
jgi:dephospho-CoA kinase